MILNKWLVAVICLVMGSLQAWDSGVLGAGRTVQALTALAIALPAVAVVVTRSYGVHVLAVAAAFVLLTIARVLSPVSLNTLHFIAFIPAMIIFFSKFIEYGKTAKRA